MPSKHILITRPGDSGKVLCEQINSQNFSALFFPLLKIMPCSDNLLLKNSYDIVIFISPNAVKFGLPLLADIKKYNQIATIGKGSLEQLKKHQITTDIFPEKVFTSEGLLQHPKLQNINDATILIVRGKGGREKLKDELVSRGANVEYADVYQRNLISFTAKKLQKINNTPFDIIQISNQQSLDTLIPIVKDMPWFSQCQWWLLSERTLNRCLQYGINKQQCILLAPGNDAFISKIMNEL